SWPIPPVFDFLKQAGNISDEEMMKTFNNGIGMVVIAPGEYAQGIIQELSNLNEKAFIIGEIIEANGSKDRIDFV
ncbi:MAG: phosphoribosylformylglycinamidine cyclo-ligase, partial [Deltaproteobacteria bacterium]|nr:phosphoribosylformylglycinamidine cyclo-ligase [Deltaproteobacteria bacterium]MBW2365451.1 phosphoribosylformylglycinamidine cyclo-ligase [Deltaproteobacteria bacterium]